MKTLRSLLGVVSGCLTVAAAGLAESAWLFGGESESPVAWRLAGLAVLAAAQVLAGFLAATVAGRRRLLHGGIVAALFALATVALSLWGPAAEPAWYRIVALATGAGAILFGGWLATTIRLRK